MATPAHDSHPTWRQLLEEQDGVLSRVQARATGLSEDQWQWRLDSGRWQSVLPGVAVAHSGDVTARQRAWSAVVYAGAGACLTVDAALVVHGMRLPDPVLLHVVAPRELTAQVLRSPAGDPAVGVRFHRVSRVEQSVHPARRPPALRAAPAVLHAAAWAGSDRSAEWRVAAAVQQRLVRPADLRDVLAEMPRLRRRALVRQVLDDVELGAHAGSELEFLSFLRRHRLPAPDQLQRPVRTGTVRYLDAWWERRRVTVEVDGAHHRLVGTWDDDALRGNDVVIAERHDRVLLLRYTRSNLRHDGPRVAGQLRAALL